MQNTTMTLANSPTFYSTYSDKWPFSIKMPATHLYYCTFNTQHYSDEAYYKAGIELPYHLTTAITKRKAEYLVGRVCAQKALQQLNITDYPLFQQDKSPLWPQSTAGSITHSHHLAAAIIAKNTIWLSLGLDIELLLTKPRSEKLLSTIINANEQRLINEDTALFITIAFSIKESLFKALYPLTLKRFYFQDAEIIDWQANGTITLKLLIDLSEEWRSGTIIEGLYCLKEGYIWTVIGIKNTKN